jgi:hypothetical protein
MRCLLQSLACSLGVASVAGPADQQDTVTTTRELVARWVQTEQLTSQTRSEWERDKEVLQQTRVLYERELQSLSETLARISTNSTQVELERKAAEAELNESAAALERARQIVSALEKELGALIPLLPTPLLEQARPLLHRLPTNSATTSAPVTERIQAVVGFLNEVDKFNGAVAVVSGREPDAQGREVSVDVLYVGLGVAYYSDPTGDVAGSGTPTPQGWRWTLQPALGPRIRDAIAMYRNTRQANFVGLPIRIDD